MHTHHHPQKFPTFPGKLADSSSPSSIRARVYIMPRKSNPPHCLDIRRWRNSAFLSFSPLMSVRIYMYIYTYTHAYMWRGHKGRRMGASERDKPRNVFWEKQKGFRENRRGCAHRQELDVKEGVRLIPISFYLSLALSLDPPFIPPGKGKLPGSRDRGGEN